MSSLTKLDLEVRRRVMEMKDDEEPTFSPSSNMADAWRVVEHMLDSRFPNHAMSFGMEYSGVIDWVASFAPRANHPLARQYEAWNAQAMFAPVAICKAALFTVNTIEGQKS